MEEKNENRDFEFQNKINNTDNSRHLKDLFEAQQVEIRELGQHMLETQIVEEPDRISRTNTRTGVLRDKTSGRQTNEDVNKIMQLLKIKKSGFNPNSKIQFDDAIESWTRLIEGLGLDSDLLKYVIFRVGAEDIQEIMRERNLLQ